MAVDPYRAYVASKLARYERVTVHAPDRRGRMRPKVRYVKVQDGWGPLEALEDAKRLDREDVFLHCAALVRLCSDEKARAMPEHRLIHLASGVVGCAGPAMLVATARSLGIPDDRANELVDHLEHTCRAPQGFIGGGS